MFSNSLISVFDLVLQVLLIQPSSNTVQVPIFPSSNCCDSIFSFVENCNFTCSTIVKLAIVGFLHLWCSLVIAWIIKSNLWCSAIRISVYDSSSSSISFSNTISSTPTIFYYSLKLWFSCLGPWHQVNWSLQNLTKSWRIWEVGDFESSLTCIQDAWGRLHTIKGMIDLYFPLNTYVKFWMWILWTFCNSFMTTFRRCISFVSTIVWIFKWWFLSLLYHLNYFVIDLCTWVRSCQICNI